jgi:predicted aldo/keto reductase-like oxidoreductase
MKVFGGQLKGEQTELSHCRMPGEHRDLAFRYAMSLPQIACAVIGMATREELHQNLNRAKSFKPLSSKEEEFLDRIGKQLAGDWGAHLGAVV